MDELLDVLIESGGELTDSGSALKYHISITELDNYDIATIMLLI